MRAVNAFIVAAGLGERLRPITNHIPKPLLPLLGSPVIEVVLERLTALPLKKIGINMHYRWEGIRDWAMASAFSNRITLFREDDLLGTGGALKNAASMLGSAPFIVHNADIISDIDLSRLVEVHESSGSLVTLAVHDHPDFNNVWLDERGRLKAVDKQGPSGTRAVAFTGIAVYSPDFLELLPEGRSSVVGAWLSAVSQGAVVQTVDVTGCYWTDIGSPSAYFAAVHDALARSGEQFHLHSDLDCSLLDLEGWAVLEEGCRIMGYSSVKRTVVLPGAILGTGTHLEDSIAGPDYVVSVRHQDNQPAIPCEIANILFLNNIIAIHPEVSPIGFGGSDRRYYRVRDDRRSVVVLRTSGADPDFSRQTEYNGFFRRHSVPVPELLAADEDEGTAVFGDLGDISLYVWLKCRRDPASIEAVYRKVLDMLVTLHTRVTDHVDECPRLQARLFDYEHLRWETDYFLERYVKGVKGIMTETLSDFSDGLEGDLDRLAREVDSFPKAIVHRDFQSQNVMIMGDVPWMIDYQGARTGPPAYDLASLLWDPYCELEDEMRKRLIQYYCRGVSEYRGACWSEEAFISTILPCRLQRHMQALGAYGFLSKVKGKTYFLKYLPKALGYLSAEMETAGTEYPFLASLVKQLHDSA
ncbi:MAG: phosphotransferase [Nitrospiraceae bacterium]|nr:phosphotransferase [Nitrospiraceae bacterium]